jgi:hypothetical protein
VLAAKSITAAQRRRLARMHSRSHSTGRVRASVARRPGRAGFSTGGTPIQRVADGLCVRQYRPVISSLEIRRSPSSFRSPPQVSERSAPSRAASKSLEKKSGAPALACRPCITARIRPATARTRWAFCCSRQERNSFAGTMIGPRPVVHAAPREQWRNSGGLPIRSPNALPSRHGNSGRTVVAMTDTPPTPTSRRYPGLRPFQKGVSGNLKGRPPVARDIRELARSAGVDAYGGEPPSGDGRGTFQPRPEACPVTLIHRPAPPEAWHAKHGL